MLNLPLKFLHDGLESRNIASLFSPGELVIGTRAVLRFTRALACRTGGELSITFDLCGSASRTGSNRARHLQGRIQQRFNGLFGHDLTACSGFWSVSFLVSRPIMSYPVVVDLNTSGLGRYKGKGNPFNQGCTEAPLTISTVAGTLSVNGESLSRANSPLSVEDKEW